MTEQPETQLRPAIRLFLSAGKCLLPWRWWRGRSPPREEEAEDENFSEAVANFREAVARAPSCPKPSTEYSVEFYKSLYEERKTSIDRQAARLSECREAANRAITLAAILVAFVVSDIGSSEGPIGAITIATSIVGLAFCVALTIMIWRPIDFAHARFYASELLTTLYPKRKPKDDAEERPDEDDAEERLDDKDAKERPNEKDAYRWLAVKLDGPHQDNEEKLKEVVAALEDLQVTVSVLIFVLLGLTLLAN